MYKADQRRQTRLPMEGAYKMVVRSSALITLSSPNTPPILYTWNEEWWLAWTIGYAGCRKRQEDSTEV